MENDFILERIGKTKNRKLVDDCSLEFKEIFNKRFPDYKEALHSHSLVTVTENFEIKSIGISCMNDLLLDNFGKWLGLLIAGNPESITLKQTADVGFNVGVFKDTFPFNSTDGAVAVGTQIGIGKGVTGATRTDFNIESRFASSPESSDKNTGNGGWNSGLGKVDIPMLPFGAGGAGAISETGYFAIWHLTSGQFNVSTFMLSRDNIFPTVNFLPAQTINVDYSLLLA